MISTAARGVLQSLLAVTFIPGERLTSSRVNSLAVILFGTLSYVRLSLPTTLQNLKAQNFPDDCQGDGKESQGSKRRFALLYGCWTEG